MGQAPQVFSAEAFRDYPVQTCSAQGGNWYFARPLSRGGLLTRIRIAWLVFMGRYDALKWEEC